MRNTEAQSASWPSEFKRGDRVVVPTLPCAMPVGTVKGMRWSGIQYGWMYAVLWDEDGDTGAQEIARRRNKAEQGRAIRWQARQLERA